jgi:hypothetical protein
MSEKEAVRLRQNWPGESGRTPFSLPVYVGVPCSGPLSANPKGKRADERTRTAYPCSSYECAARHLGATERPY